MPYERFTDRARKVMKLAEQEARRFNHDYIGTEHLLLGFLKEGSGVAAHVLKEFGLEMEKLRAETEKRVAAGRDPLSPTYNIPPTPRLKSVLEFAHDEARELNHHYVGTEHLLLGLVREQNGIAFDVLSGLGVEFDQVRQKVLEVLAVPLPKTDGFTDTPPTLEDVGKYFAIRCKGIPDDIKFGIFTGVRHNEFTKDPHFSWTMRFQDGTCEFFALDFLPRCEKVVEAVRERRERKFGSEGGAE